MPDIPQHDAIPATRAHGPLYYALFPLDFLPTYAPRAIYEFQKNRELVPIYGWLVPALVLATGLGHLHGAALVGLLGLAAAGLAIAARFHLKLRWNQGIEVWLNLWLSMVGVMLVASLVAYLAGTMGLAGAPSRIRH